MATDSLSFSGIDLSAYDLIVSGVDIPVTQRTKIIPVRNKGIAGTSSLESGKIGINISITGTDMADVISNLDNIKAALNKRGDENLSIDIISGRYWKARFESMDGDFIGTKLWKGSLSFVTPDPAAYSTTNTSSDHNIDADPDTVTETPGGNMYIEPVYTLTAGENLTGVTIKLENTDTEESIEWTGSLATGEELEVNCETWVVSKEGVADMAAIDDGQFPRLLGGQDNHIKVTGFSTTGTLNIAYRAKYI